MKSSSVKLGVTLVVLMAIFNPAETWGENWKVYGYGPDGTFTAYYDENVTRPSKSMVRVHEKKVFTEKGVSAVVERLGKGFEKLSYSISLYELDCANKKERILSAVTYSDDGNVLSSESVSEPQWHSIIPDSFGEIFYGTVCK